MNRLFNITFLLILISATGFAQTSGEIFVTKDGAIRGYDAVAFFSENKPVKGQSNLSIEWKNATWYFATKQNLELFKADPEKYAPQYGGYCAFGMAEGHKAPTQTETWTIIDNKLYFNYNADVKKEWSKDTKAFIEKADVNWKQQ